LVKRGEAVFIYSTRKGGYEIIFVNSPEKPTKEISELPNKQGQVELRGDSGSKREKVDLSTCTSCKLKSWEQPPPASQ